MAKKKSEKEKFIEHKMSKIYHEGIRDKAPVSNAQAYAVANSYYERRKK